MSKTNSKPTAEAMTAEAVAAEAMTKAGRAVASVTEARETGAHTVVKAIMAARAAMADPSDRAVATAVHAAAIADRAERLGLDPEAPAVTKGLGLGNVRAYVGAAALLAETGATVTPKAATAAYRAVVAGAKAATVKAARARAEWEALTAVKRAEALPIIVTEALKAQAKAKAEAKAEAEAGGTGDPAAPEAEASEAEASEAEASGQRDPEAEALALLSGALASLPAVLKSPEARDRAAALLGKAYGVMTGTDPEALASRLAVAEAVAAEAEAEAAALAERLAALAPEAVAAASV